MALVTKILEGTLASGQTSINFNDTDLPNSLIRIYTTKPDLFPTSQTLNGTILTVTFKSQTSNVGVAVELSKQGLEIVDNVESSAADKALSANQGKALNTSLQEVFTSVSSGKSLIAAAITDKGVETAADATFAVMAENISNIPTGGGGSPYTVEFKYNGTANGSNTYTITEKGYYLMIAGYSFGGSASITLPEGVTALYSDEVSASDVYSGVTRYRGVKVVIAELDVDDVVTMYSTYFNNTWPGHGKVIYKLTGLDDKTLATVSKPLTKDATGNLPAINTPGDYLVIGVATGSSNANSMLVNGKSKLLSCDMARVGNGWMFSIALIGSVNASPELSMYGYSGGQATYFIISIE